MNNRKILILEIKDRYVKATLLLMGYDMSVLFDDKIYYKKNNLENIFNFDFIWISELKKLLEINHKFDPDRDITIILFNNSQVYINSNHVAIESQIEDSFFLAHEITKSLEKNYLDQKILNISNITNAKTDIFWYQYELINKNFYNYFQNILLKEGFKNINFKNYITIQRNSINSFVNNYEKIFVFDFEESYLTFSKYKDGNLEKIFKKKFGLTNFYENISKNMKVEFRVAKEIFDNMGDLISKERDNKIIFSRKDEKNIFKRYTKSDLSSYIEETFNDFFKIVGVELLEIDSENDLVIFAGKIVALPGLKEYLLTKMKTKEIILDKNEIIGLERYNSFVTRGLINNFYVNNSIFFKNYFLIKSKKVKYVKQNSKPFWKLFARIFTYSK